MRRQDVLVLGCEDPTTIPSSPADVGRDTVDTIRNMASTSEYYDSVNGKMGTVRPTANTRETSVVVVQDSDQPTKEQGL